MDIIFDRILIDLNFKKKIDSNIIGNDKPKK